MPGGGKLTLETQAVFVDEPRTETRLESRPGWHVMIAVSDTGVGMDAETKAGIFEPFFHHETARAGHRPRPFDRLRDREAEWREYLG